MKKLINRPDDVVREELAGVALAHAGRLVVHTDPHWIARADAPVAGKVAAIRVKAGDTVQADEVVVTFE